MLEKLRSWVLRWLRLRVENDTDNPDKYVQAYEDITGEDITATVAAKLAKLVFADSTLTVTTGEGRETSARADLIAQQLNGLWADADWITAQMLGKGGKALVPLYSGGRLTIATLDQNRLLIRGKDGRRISAATLLADHERLEGVDYFLMVDYELRPVSSPSAGDGFRAGSADERGPQSGFSGRPAGMAQVMRYRAVKEGGEPVALDTVQRWADVPEEITIAGVDRLLFAFLRCPRDNRVDSKCHGVPITYGAEGIIAEMVEHAKIYRREFRLTRPMLGLDSSLWRSGTQPTDINAVRSTVQDSDDPFVPVERSSVDGAGAWQYYAPAIRQEAMEARWQHLCRRLEKACGLSQGILTERQTMNYANRDEVRAAQYDTFSVVKAVREQWERAMDDLAYALDVLAERYGVTPAGSRGQYSVEFDWDTSLIESTSETFEQYLELLNARALSRAELRQWVKGGTLEEAKQAIADMEGEPDAGEGDDAGLLAALRGAGED